MVHKGRAKKGLNVIQGIEGAIFLIRLQPDFSGGAGQDPGRYLRIFEACGVYRRAAKGSDLPKSSEKSASVLLEKEALPRGYLRDYGDIIFATFARFLAMFDAFF